MTRSKKIFFLFIVIFVILLAFASYDISTRTTFPGSKPQLEERLKKKFDIGDSLDIDSSSNKLLDKKKPEKNP